MHYGLYRLLSRLVFATAFPCFLIYCIFTGKQWAELSERLGFYKKIEPAGKNPRIWLHAASVGEVQVARALIAEIKKQIPHASLVLSTMTEQGQLVARKQLGNKIRCIYAPLDSPGIVKRALQTIRPSAYICLETELWPNILRQARQNGAKLFLLNARLSEKSFTRYSKVRGLAQDVLANFSTISAILPDDADRYKKIGAPPGKVVVNGNAKYEITTTGDNQVISEQYRRQLKISDQTILVAGSTHTGEEEILLKTYQNLKKVIKNLIWLVAPRHLERLPEIESAFVADNIGYQLLSNAKQQGRREDVVIIDTMGDLAEIYSLASYVFCGGSLVDRGGHNLMEAAIWGKPVFYGPSMRDFLDAKDLLESVNAGFMVNSAGELSNAIIEMYNRPEEYEQIAQRARQIALAQQGSARRQIKIVTRTIYS
ncbi:MAG: 3-deoxy-D-manno-octulosonic acid transferase [Proteobacteria bacterium]|nr:3-deoxy-D-manno-octulosonic acid transferase [Pseudomonadota bacterium]MBU1715861.1 3-deoxy-D-manno-octulosonic acid transferase [Pseudomonadota bacterium]